VTERVIIVGGGHNGLVCAAYLARAGRKVTVVEAAPFVGGAAVTREFVPGFKVSACAHLLYGLDPVVARELALASHGLSYSRTNVRNVALSPGGPPLVLDREHAIEGDLSDADRAALTHFTKRMHRFASLLARQHRRAPPRLAWNTWGAAMQAAALAFDIRRLGRGDMREFLRIATMNVFDVLEDTFENPLLKGALAMDAVLGTKLGPRSGHTVLNLLHRWSGGGSAAIPRGGMGAVTRALAAAAKAAGAEIRLASPVASILLEGDRASGVRLATGEELHADVVISNADPKQTLLTLLGARHLDTEFARRVNHYRTQGTAAKLHLALSALPAFPNVEAAHLGERLLIAPDLEYIENAFNPAKYREPSRHPVLEITIPTVHDETLAPPGQHVLSAIIQYAPYDIEGGWDAPAAGGDASTRSPEDTGLSRRTQFGEHALDVLETCAPGLRSLIVGAELLTPFDIEREFRITGGHWHHGELTLDQFLMLRPVPGAAQYATPVPNLYLCGAGTHPGGGVMGSAGYNAARAVLRASTSEARRQRETKS
jgi:phytoene dehydrogenase-like protein